MKNKKIIFAGLSLAVFMGVVFSANAAKQVTLKVEKNSKGTVTSDDGKINCGSDCKEIYYSGGSINLYAKPANGFTFDNWTGNACGDAIGMGISTSTSGAMGSCQVSLYYNSNKTITATAHFKKISGTGSSSSKSSKSSSSKSSKSSSSKSSSSRFSSSKSSSSSATSTSTYTLKINKSGKGYVSDGGNLACGTKCQDKYLAGAEVKLTAVPDGGYVFEKFSPEKECSSVYSGGFGFNDKQWIKQTFAYGPAENVVCVTTMNKNKTITAIFKKIPSSSSSRSSKPSSSRSSSSKSSSSSNKSSTASSGEQLIMITSLKPNDRVNAMQPIIITGKARNVFGEGEFDISASYILSSQKKVVARTIATCNITGNGCDWTSGNFVDFKSTLNLSSAPVCYVSVEFYKRDEKTPPTQPFYVLPLRLYGNGNCQ